MDSMLESLARVVLPEEILDSFEIKDVVRTSSEIHIHLDEVIPDKMRGNANFESKGFTSATSVTDFPIRDHKVILVIRRRRWTDLRDGSSFTLPLDSIAAAGTRYSKEFASFLKVPSPSIGNEIKRTHTSFTPYLCFGEHKSRNAHGA